MAFFDLPEGQKYFEGGLHEQEDVAVYTWGEDGYDGLGDALLEGGDDFNDETFGGSGPVGRDFDFESQMQQFHHSQPPKPGASGAPHESQKFPQESNQAKDEGTGVSALWDSKSPFSVLPRMSNTRPNEHARTTSAGTLFPTGSMSSTGGGSKPRIRTVQEIEEEMRAAAARQRVHSSPQVPPAIAREPVPYQPPPPPQLTVEEVERQMMAHHISPHLAPASPHRHPQQAHQPHVAQIPSMNRGHERAHSGGSLTQTQVLQFLQAQQLQEQQQQQLAAQAALPQGVAPQYLIHQHKPQQSITSADELLRVQQLYADQQQHKPQQQSIASAEELLRVQQLYAEQQELARQQAQVQAMERDAKRRRVALKLARMSKNNDLMTQSDKDFITRIQVSQLAMADPYEQDFYNVVLGNIRRQPTGVDVGQPGKEAGQGQQRGGRRRQNAMQRMEAQVDRIINNVRLREKEKGLHSINHLQGALGKTSGRSYKAAPRQLLQMQSPVNAQPPKNGIDGPPHIANGHEIEKPVVESATRKPLTTRESLIIVENVYDVVIQLEHLNRGQPPAEDVEAMARWTEIRNPKLEELFTSFPFRVPKDACVPHPVISLLKSTKGKRVFHRVMRQLEMADRLDLLICIVNNFTQLDVVADSQLLDQPDANAERRELERQTHLFLQSVWQPLVTLILELSLPPIIHMLSALLQRADLVRLVSSKPGIILLTSFFAQVENIKQNIAEGAAVPAEDLARWQWIYNEWFDVLSPHLVGLFPSTRLAMNLPFGAEPYLKPSALTDAMDLPIWKFLATFSIHASLEQQQVLVTVLRDKVLENLVSASKGWNTEESVRRVANVNQFLNALGLDSSQIAL